MLLLDEGRLGIETRHLAASAGAALVDTLALADIDRGLVVDSGVAHAFLDLASHGQESLLDVGRILGRSLEEWDAERVGKFLHLVLVPLHNDGRTGDIIYLCNAVFDDLLVCHVTLVAYEELVDALGCVAVNLLQPLLDVVEAVHVGNIVDDADAMGTAVVRRRDCAETLLTCSIPLCCGPHVSMPC